MGNKANSRAVQLKEEGNALLSQHKYKRAYEKYTQAIQVDNENAVLYANRSACLMSMKRVTEALNDGKKATELDPAYGKGWARLGAASEASEFWEQAVVAWQRALESLPSVNMSKAEAKQKEQFTTGLTNSETQLRLRLAKRKADAEAREKLEIEKAKEFVMEAGAITPWNIAKWLVPVLREQGDLKSSAFVIHTAHKEYSKGYDLMRRVEKISGVWTGERGAVEALLKGILRDRRIFHLYALEHYKQFADQINFESSELQAWVNSTLSIKQILEEVKTRLQDGGWNNTRPALNLTIQAWVLRGFVMSRIPGDHEGALVLYNKAIQTIEMADEIWKDVKPMDKGLVFRQWFMRGVKSLRLESYENVCFTRSKKGDDPQYPMSRLLDLAMELVDHELIQNHNPQQSISDPGSQNSFYVYPMTQAFAVRALCFEKTAMYHSKTESESMDNQIKASTAYLLALQGLPRDEEYHYVHLYSALNAAWRAKTGPEVTKPLLDTYYKHKEDMLRLWVNTDIAKTNQHDTMDRVIKFQEVVGKMNSLGMGGITPMAYGITHDI